MNFGLSESQVKFVIKILDKYFSHQSVWVFGSRASNTFKPFSDLDLAIVGSQEADIQSMLMAQEEFQNSDLPIKVDLVDYLKLSAGFKANVDQNHIVLK